MIHIPVLRWGEPYKSLDIKEIVHFETGELLAEVSQANPGLIGRDMRQALRARDILREIPCRELLAMLKNAAGLFMEAELPAGDGSQTPNQFVECQSATTGLPLHMVRLNMEKLHYVLTHLDEILTSLMRGIDFEILTRGYGEEDGILRAYKVASPVLGLILPSNSPGVHGLWLPVIPLQIGLVLKAGSLEPWTALRMTEAFFQAGVPRESVCIYPGDSGVGTAVLQHCPRSLIFGGTATVEQYRNDPRIQVHGPGFSKILIGDDEAENWAHYVDLMVESILTNSGRGCINCSGIWTPRHGRAIANALAERLGPIMPKPADDPEAALAAFTTPTQAVAVNTQIDNGLAEAGVDDVTANYRDGDRLILQERCAYMRPTIIYCDSSERTLANAEYMFPFCSVVECPQDQMMSNMGDTLVCSAFTNDEVFRRALVDAENIDRLNLGAIPTTRLNWLQPHEGNIVDFLFRSRAFQMA